MNRLELIYDGRLILSKSKVGDDFRINNRHMGYVIDLYRARDIRDTFKRNHQIDPVWLQDFGVINTTEVTSADDPSIISGNVSLGIIELPDMVSLPGDEGFHRISGVSKMGRFFPKSFPRLMNIIETAITETDGQSAIVYPRGSLCYSARQGNKAYVWPYMDKVNGSFILESPLDGFVIHTAEVESGTLIKNEIYEVKEGVIVYNGTQFKVGDVFAAIPGITAFSGGGKLQFRDKRRKMTNKDPYPMSATQAITVMLNVLTKHFGIEQQVVSDTINDSADQLRIISDAGDKS